MEKHSFGEFHANLPPIIAIDHGSATDDVRDFISMRYTSVHDCAQTGKRAIREKWSRERKMTLPDFRSN